METDKIEYSLPPLPDQYQVAINVPLTRCQTKKRAIEIALETISKDERTNTANRIVADGRTIVMSEPRAKKITVKGKTYWTVSVDVSFTGEKTKQPINDLERNNN